MSHIRNQKYADEKQDKKIISIWHQGKQESKEDQERILGTFILKIGI
jgi:hypothetical protein